MHIKSVKEYDVVVCGGGPTGVAAAVTASRAGLKVILLELCSQLGGMGTSGLVSHWLGGRSSETGEWIVGGVFKEICKQAANRGFALLPKAEGPKEYSPHGWDFGPGQLAVGIPFDPFSMAAYLDEYCASAGVKVMLLSHVIDVCRNGDKIDSVIIGNKNGLHKIKGNAFIDATGDADIADFSGCDVILGREKDNLMAPATLGVHVYNVNQNEIHDYIAKTHDNRMKKIIQNLKDDGQWPFEYEIFISVQLLKKGEMFINTSRLCNVNGCDAESLSDAYFRGRKETFELLKIAREYFPGFKNAQIKSLAPLLGVRETRRIIANYILCVDDIIKGKKFGDKIGLSSYGWDMPDPIKPSHQPMHENGETISQPFIEIPYRIMLPKPVNNLICPGRSVSVQREVLGPLRVTAPCMAMGQAAGEACLAICENNVSFSNVNITKLQERLLANGAILEA